MLIHADNAPKLVATRPDVTWEVTSVERVSAENTSGEVVTQDAVVAVTSSETSVYSEARLEPSLIAPATFQSLDPSIASVSPRGEVTWVSDGTARIVVSLGGSKKMFRVTVLRRLTVSGVSIFLRWVPGSVAGHCTDNVETRISGLVPSSATLSIYSSRNDVTSTYTRNPEAWCADYHPALTGCNVWQSNWGDGKSRAQTAITPRHIVGANHYGPPINIGGVQRFVATNGTVVNRTVTHTRRIGDTDIQLSFLSADLPDSITPVSVLPADWSDYIVNLNHGVPCLCRNQYGEADVSDLYHVETRGGFFRSFAAPSRQMWWREKVVGDSGGPAMLMIDGKLVLVTTWKSPTSGPSYSYQAVDWVAEIAALDVTAGVSTGYLPDAVDLSGFTDFSV